MPFSLSHYRENAAVTDAHFATGTAQCVPTNSSTLISSADEVGALLISLPDCKCVCVFFSSATTKFSGQLQRKDIKAAVVTVGDAAYSTSFDHPVIKEKSSTENEGNKRVVCIFLNFASWVLLPQFPSLQLTTSNLLVLFLLLSISINLSSSHFSKKHLIFGKLKLKKWLIPKLIIGKSFAVKGALFAKLLHMKKPKKQCCMMVVQQRPYYPPPMPYYGGGGGGGGGGQYY